MTILSPNSRTSLLAVLAAAVLAGCGGGGGGGSSAGSPAIASAVAGTASYSQLLTLTLTGSNLDQGVSVTATGCSGVAIIAASSNATTARYQCTVSSLGAGQFVVAAGGGTLATAPFTVPAPQVTLNYSNSSGVTGAIVLTLSPDKAPITVNNFLSYVNGSFYTGTVIHRVSPGFIIQGGGYTAPFNATTQTLKAANAAIALEVGKGLSNTQWTIAMARSDAANTATSQFFINLADNSGTLDPGLTAGYAVFGTVTGAASTAGVSNIAAAPCVALSLVLPTGDCAPTPNVVITSATQTL